MAFETLLTKYGGFSHHPRFKSLLEAQAAEVFVILTPALLSGTRDGVQVELCVDRDVLLHLVVPFPVPHHRCLQVVPERIYYIIEEVDDNLETFTHFIDFNPFQQLRAKIYLKLVSNQYFLIECSNLHHGET